MRDEQIIDLYWERNEDAIHQTGVKYGAYLWKISYNVLSDREDSGECVNDTYLAAWNSMPPNRPNALSAYLGKIVRQLSIDVFRKKNSAKRGGSEYVISLEELGEAVPDRHSTEQSVDKKLLGESVDAFLRTLPADARNAFIGRYYFFDSLKEVAAYCGISEGKAKTLLHRTRINLKAYLSKEGFLL